MIKATKEDVDRIIDLDNKAFAGQQGVTKEEIFDNLENGFIFLKEDVDHSLLSYFSVITKKSQVNQAKTAGKIKTGQAYVSALAVDPDYQNKGIGSMVTVDIFQAVQKEGIEEILTVTRPENVRILKIAFGFKAIVYGYDAEYFGSDNGFRVKLKTGPDFVRPQLAGDSKNVIVVSGDSADLRARDQIISLLNKGYIGVSAKVLNSERFLLEFKRPRQDSNSRPTG